MTFEEKVGQLRGGWPGVTAYAKTEHGVEIADAWKPLLTNAPIGLLGSTLRAEPWLVAEMGKAAVRGFQGASLNTDHSVVALLRAYPGLGDADGGHDFTGFSRGMRDLHEVALRPWGEAIRAGAEGVMIEQSEMDGVPVPCSHYYLDELLRKQWGFRGIALDDNGGIERLVHWCVAADKVQAAALALRAGNDLAVSDANPNLPLVEYADAC
jgi:beta-glucosidase